MTTTLHLAVSTSVDAIRYQDGSVEIRAGGPAKFAQAVFESAGCGFRMLMAPGFVEAHITASAGGETGRIAGYRRCGKPTVLSPRNLLVSTIGPECGKSFLSGVCADALYLDFQGVVRPLAAMLTVADFDARFRFRDFVGKATVQELAKIHPILVERIRRDHVLIVTDGPRDVAVWSHGVLARFRPHRLACRPRDTIGAGDTFFAAFVANHVRTGDCATALRHALSAARDFLNSKCHG